MGNRNNRTQQLPQTSNNRSCTGCLSVFILFCFLIFFADKGDTKQDTTTVATTEKNTTEHIEELSDEQQFVLDFKEYQNKDISLNIYKIYTKEIGFNKVYFSKQLDDSLNYEIIADGHKTVVTIIGDEDYRIFKPNSPFTFYENKSVVTTAEDLENQTIDSIDMTSYYVVAKTEIESCLKNSKSAEFPSQNEISYQRNKDLVALQGYVYAENSFGATVRSDWIIQFYVHDLDQYSYTVTYINIDGNTSGEWIEFE